MYVIKLTLPFLPYDLYYTGKGLDSVDAFTLDIDKAHVYDFPIDSVGSLCASVENAFRFRCRVGEFSLSKLD